MPLLLRDLAIAGSRKADGTPNASGYVVLYSPGTTTVVTSWKDEAMTQAWSTVSGGVPLDASGKATIWVQSQVDVVVQDSTGATLQTLAGYADTPISTVTVQNAGYTGAVTDPATSNVTQAAGGVTTLDTVLSSATASFGGQDFQFLESASGVGMAYRDVVRQVQLTPQMFGAVGNGLADDTAAFQKALARLAAIGGGTLYVPWGVSGTYKISSGLSLATGLPIAIVSQGATVRLTAGGSLLSGSGNTGQVRGIKLNGGSVTFTSPAGLVLDTVTISPLVADGVGTTLTLNGNGSRVVVNNCYISNATAVSMLVDGVGQVSITNTTLAPNNGGSDIGLKFANGGGSVFVGASTFVATKGVQWASTVTGTGFTFDACPSLGSGFPTTPFDATALSTDPVIMQRGCQLDSKTFTAPADGTTSTRPDTTYSSNVVKITSGVGTALLGAPLLTPNALQDGKEFVIEFWNASSGDLGSWSLNAIWHVASAISPTNNNRTCVRFRWDQAAACFREMSRAVTT